MLCVYGVMNVKTGVHTLQFSFMKEVVNNELGPCRLRDWSFSMGVGGEIGPRTVSYFADSPFLRTLSWPSSQYV